jgi:predicted DCC family thiol-disulfide oxidoreductase YuxK
VTAWVRRKDLQQKIFLMTYQQCPSPPMTPELYRACTQAVHVITAEKRIIHGGRAVLFVLEQLGYPVWFIRPLTWIPFIWFVEAGYRLIARYRSVLARFIRKNV